MRVDKFREFREDFHDLVRTLTAGCHHDDVGITLLRNRMLKHRLSATERSRDEARTAFGNRIQRVNDSDSGFHDLVRPRLFLVAFDSHFHRPFLYHRDRHVFTAFIGKDSYRMVDIVLSGSDNALHGVCSLE